MREDRRHMLESARGLPRAVAKPPRMAGFRRFGILASALLVFSGLAAIRAIADSTTAGVSIVLVHGQHTEQGGAADAPLIPAPVLSVSQRMRRFEFFAEGIPPLRSYPVGTNTLGIQAISLSFAQATARYWNRYGTLGAGVGDTLYNQQTTYLGWASPTFSNGQYDASRVAGARYELLGNLPLAGGRAVEASLAVNPSLHGRAGWTNYETVSGATTTYALPSASERGSQIEAILQLCRQTGRLRWRYGVRYLNYVAHFDDGSLADRNVFLMPFIGIDRFLGP